jgi:2-amino-4-hydroxy-6-hydroxymethyldihydropteridine diphosphokinase
MPRVYVAAGSNIDAARNLAHAGAQLQQRFGPLTLSPWYRNAAVGFVGEDFINFVVGFDSPLPVEAVVAQLREVEQACGRPRQAPKWAPRTMDLDILLYGDLVCEQPGLTLPRPDLLLRPYMLGPLADIAPTLRHPTAGATIGELWQRFDRSAHAMHAVAITAAAPASAHDRCR